MIEVSASHVDRSECLTYRKQNLNVTSTLRPHFNPIILRDGTDEIAVMLENNDIYRYPRPSGNLYLEVEVLHGHTCKYKVDEEDDKTTFTCSSGSIDISLDSSTACGESSIELWASGSEDEEEAEQEKRTYYNFCPEDGDYCYLGPGDERQSYHLCSRNIASESSEGNVQRAGFEVDPANGRCGEAENACQTGNLKDLPDTDTHYKWQCVGIGDGATANCERFIPISGVCDNSVRNGCGAGTANDEAIADTATHYTWACEGLHDGSTANDCKIRKPINGVCDNSQRNACSTGDPDDAAIADTATHYRWHCKGLYGGTTVTDCQRELPPQPVNGVCDNSKRNGCSAGDSNDSAIADTNTYYRWHCVGQHGGSTVTGCQVRKPINGVCDNSKRNGCSAGGSNDAAIADTNTYYRWHCVGQHGGSTATSCQIRKPVDGVCDNSKQNGCSAGTVNGSAIADTNTYYRWHCVGQHGGTTATSCQIRKPVDGTCDNSKRNGCSVGIANDAAITDTNIYYRWHCVGQHGGTTATSCQIRKPVDGTCDNSKRNGCSVGIANDSAIADTNTYYRWHCVGQHGGTTATSCQIRKPINGACNNSQRNSCSAGTSNDAVIADTSTFYKWHCVGQHGGTTATSCQIRKPINGVCNNSQRNSCSAGTSNDAVIADTSTFYKWHCVGQHGGTTAADCQIEIPINGVCGDARNSCSAGNPSPIADSSTHHRWHCVGLHGGTTATSCQEAIPPDPVNGTCDNSVQNGCSAGTANASAIADTNTYYKWHCEGLHGGTTATGCQIRKPINGVCDNSQENSCSTGTANDAAISDTDTHYRWYCEGLHGGTTARTCQRAIPVPGVCDNSQQNSCSAGTANDAAIADTNTYYRWHCVGQHGGPTATGCQIRKPIDGVCDNSQRNGCSAGTDDDAAIGDTDTHYRWHCAGQHDGTTATGCQIRKPINGVCDNSVQNGCSAGTANDSAIADTNTLYKWHCVGEHSGTTARNCQKAIPINGVCDNTRRNGCSAGTSDDSAIADTNTHYTWHCVGQHDGTTATSCQIRKPINGACDNSQQNGCSAGTVDDAAIADTNTLYKWHCVGQHGGTTVRNCQKAIPVNGVCDNTRRNGCSAGTANASAIADTNTLYRWHCEGLNGGTTVRNCQKAIPINGVCDNSKQNGCTTGTPSDAAADDTGTHYKWYCVGINGGAIATDCEKAKPINGVCDNTRRNGCSAGTVNDIAIVDTNTLYKWQCEGQHGGSTVTDCEKTKSIDGVCDYTRNRVNRCQNGTTLNDIDDTDTLYKWQCVGLNGGRTLTCSRPKVDCSFHKYICDKGSPEDLSEGNPVPPIPESGEATHYTWRCVSDDRKAIASCRSLKKTAYCGGNVGLIEGKDVDVYLVHINTCLTGTPVDIEEVGDMHRWACDWYESRANCSVVKHAECRPSSAKLCNAGATRTNYDSSAGTWNCAGGTTSVRCSRDEE